MQTAEGSHATTEAEAAFREFVPIVEPLLRTALIATYGPERGAEATAEALAYAWEHWNEVRKYEKPADYLYRVGQSRTRSRKVRDLFHRSKEQQYWVEPGLGAALSELSPGQRAAVVLVFAAGNTPTEAAELLGLSVSTVKTNTKRGLEHLRQSLGAIDDEQ